MRRRGHQVHERRWTRAGALPGRARPRGGGRCSRRCRSRRSPRSTASRSAAVASSRWLATSSTPRRRRSSGNPRSSSASCPASAARSASRARRARDREGAGLHRAGSWRGGGLLRRARQCGRRAGGAADKALETARLIASKSPLALRSAKAGRATARSGRVRRTLADEARVFGELLLGGTRRRGLRRSSRSARLGSPAAERGASYSPARHEDRRLRQGRTGSAWAEAARPVDEAPRPLRRAGALTSTTHTRSRRRSS